MATDLTTVLLGQWRDSPKLTRLVTDVIQDMRDQASNALTRIELLQDIGEATGVWLDELGTRVGIRRPATTDPSMDPRFGFSGVTQARGFDLEPFRGDAANDAVYPLPDAVFRRFVRSRAVLVLGDGTIQTFTRALREIDPAATVVDNRDMTITVTTLFQELVELADQIGALPRTAGVLVVYV